MTGFSQPERRALQRMQVPNPESHPDADLLTAFTEHSLTTRENDQVLSHLAGCASCREIVALAGSPLVEPVSEPARKRGLWEMPLFHWGAVAATTVVVVAAVSLGVREYRNETPQMAALHKEQAPVAMEQPEDKVVAEPKAKAQPANDLEASTPAAAPAENAPLAPRRSLHVQQEARYERPHNETAKKQEVASAGVGGTLHGNVASGGLVTNTDTRDYLFSANSNAVLKDKAADLSSARTVAAPPPAPPATIAQNVPVSGASEMVTVDVKSSEVKTDQRAWAAAKVAPQSVIVDEKANGYSTDSLSLQKSAKEAVAGNRWQITNGKLQHSAASSAASRDWQTVLPNQTFRSVAAIQNHVWAGGDNGLLYHSADNGQSWSPVPVKNGTATLTGNIVSLRFTDAQNGSLLTSTSETWTTNDGGQSWQKK